MSITKEDLQREYPDTWWITWYNLDQRLHTCTRAFMVFNMGGLLYILTYKSLHMSWPFFLTIALSGMAAGFFKSCRRH